MTTNHYQEIIKMNALKMLQTYLLLPSILACSHSLYGRLYGKIKNVSYISIKNKTLQRVFLFLF